MGRELVSEHRVQVLTREARARWSGGAQDWPEASAVLERAIRISPGHPEVKRLLDDMRTEGTLRITADSPDIRFEIEAIDGGGGAFVDHTDSSSGPRVLPIEDAMRLHVGQYVVMPQVKGEMREDLSFPVFIGHVLFRTGRDGWRLERRLVPGELPLDQGAAELQTAVVIAEQVVLEDLAVPRAVPAGMRWVPAGPFYRSEPDFGDGGVRLAALELSSVHGNEAAAETAVVYKEHRIVPDDLERGFLMAKRETTVAEFRRWFGQRGHEYCEWLVEEERVLLDRRTIRQVREAVRRVPLARQLEYWSDPSREKPIPSAASPDELVDLMFAEELKRSRSKWSAYETRIRRALDQEDVESRPVGNVDYGLAMAFARTHQPIINGEFCSWLDERIGESVTTERRLSELRDRLAGSEEAFVPVEVLPEDLLVGRHGGVLVETRPRPVASAYGDYLYYGLFYACQAPVPELCEWIRTKGGLDPALAEACVAKLGRPEQWLFEPGPDGERIYEPLILKYTWWAGNADRRFPREHFVGWIERMIPEQQERTATLALLRSEPPDERSRKR